MIIRKYNFLYTKLFLLATVFFLVFYSTNVKALTKVQRQKLDNNISVDNISFGSSLLVMDVGDTMTLHPIITPTNASNKNVSWISTNINVASVDSDGTVIAKNYGYVKIIAVTEDGNKKAVISLVIRNKINVVFHRNLDSNDTVTVLQNFSLGNSYDNKTKKGNRFGYNVDGTEGTKKIFNEWNTENKSIIGWTTTPNSKEKKYSLYSSVSDEWIENVFYNKYSVQKNPATIDLYAVWGENVDLALFWGQSNMLGSVGKYNKELQKDNRLTELKGTIDADIIKTYQRMNYVETLTDDNTVFELKIASDGIAFLQDIKTSNTIINDKNRSANDQNTVDIGEKLSYDVSTGKLKKGYITTNPKRYSLEKSYGTNMIPEFGKTYYEKTKHKLVAVMAANGGEQISNFLPHCKSSKDSNCTNDGQYIYEALKAKYLAAVSYLENNGYYIKNKFYVAYQGEADSTYTLSTISLDYKKSPYYSNFMKVHNNLVKDLNLSFGTVVFTGGRSSDSKNSKQFQYVKNIHTLQSRLVNDNSNIISGSSLGYRAYTNCKSKNSCRPIPYMYSSQKENNIHLTSAALSQIGRETAMNIVNSNKLK